MLEEAKEQDQEAQEGEKKQQKREELQTTGRSSRKTEGRDSDAEMRWL